MDQFVKLKKKMSMTESTRQMLNKSIDLLHKLSKKKVTADAVKKELSAYLSNHILTLNQMDGDKQHQLEEFIAIAGEIVDSVDGGKIPLYEGIMALNKMVMPENQVQEELKREKAPVFIRLNTNPEPPMVSNEFDPTGSKIEESTMTISLPKEEPKKEIAELISEVLKNKEVLDKSVLTLNTTLKDIGYELKPVK